MPTEPYEVVPRFDPSRPYEIVPRFDPSKPYQVVRLENRDSYEAQLEDLGITPAEAAEATRLSDRKADLFAAQQEALRQGEYWQGVADRIDRLTATTVEPLTRPLSGAVGRAADVFVPGPPVIEPTLQQAGIHLPRAGEAETTAGKVAAGTYNAVADLVSSLTSPDTLALLPAATSKTVLTAWISQMAGEQPERVMRAAELFKQGKTQEGVQEVATGIGELGLVEVGRRHVMRSPEVLTAYDVEGLPRLNINRRGQVVDQPSPDLVARNLAATGTLRATEQRAFGPPEADRPPGMVQFERVPLFNRSGEVLDVQVRPARIREIVLEEPSIIQPELKSPRIREIVLEEPSIIETEPKIRPAPAISEPLPPDAANAAPAAEGLTAPPSEPVSARPETFTAPDARLGAESPDARGLQTTERIAAAGAEAPAPVPSQQAIAGRASAAALESQRPPDILDFIQDQVGAVRKHTGVAEHSQSLYDSEAYSKLLARRQLATKILAKGGVPADVAAQAAFEAGWLREPSADALWERMEAAAATRAVFYRTRGGPEAQKLRQQQQQSDNFAAAQRPSIRRESVTAGELNTGDRFKLKGEDFEVRALEFDPDTLDVTAVRVKDGPKFGDQTVSADLSLKIDKGSLQTKKPDTSFDPQRVPGIVSNTAAEAWADRTIAEGRQRLHAGIDPELMAAYLTKGVAHLERGTRQFAAWSRKMLADYGDAIRPHLRTLFEQSQRTLQQLSADGRKMRGLSRRGTTSEQLPEASRARLTTDPASFYRKQRAKTIEDAVALMTNAELRRPLDLALEGNAQNWVARQLELSRRLMADPVTRAEGYALFQGLSKTGTSFGQLVNQFKLLRNSTPDGLLEIVNRRLVEQGAPALTPPQRIQLRVLAGQNLKHIAAWRGAEEAWARQPTRANFKAVVEARAAAEASGRFFNERVQRMVPRGFWDTLTAMSMGNKLSMLSQERNVVANLALMPWRAAARLPAAAIDMLDSLIRAKPREIALVPQYAWAGAGRAALDALPEAARVLYRGDTASGLGKGETHINLRPLVALKEIIAGELLKPNKRLAHRLTLLAEASPPAYFATGMLRGVNALDMPFFAAARGRLITEELKLMQKRSGGKLKTTSELVRQAVLAPELFLSPKALARINQEALGSVFQDPNIFTRWVVGLEQMAPGPARFLLRNIMPFISLPINWAGKLLGWSPAGFFTHAARYALQGNSRAAKLATGEAIIGSMAWYAASYLFSKGILAPPLDSEDEKQKMRLLSGDIMPPNHVNLSGLRRLLAGENPAWRPGDETKDFTYYGSVVGAQMQIVAAAHYKAEKQPVPTGLSEEWSRFLFDATAGAGNYLVNQTFLTGVRDLLEALRSDRKMEAWLASYIGALTDTAVPRQLESINTAVREFQREIKDDALDKRLHNGLVNRLGLFTTADDDLPFKRDVWGRPLRSTPEGSNPWLYQLFDVGKSRQMAADPIKIEIYNLARRTGDLRAIPTPPDKSLTIQGRTYQLTAVQHSRLQELIGQRRELLANRLFNAQFLRRSDAQKLSILQRAWALGSHAGVAVFYREAQDELTEKPKPKGFR
jgi:hypothetical protein